MKLVFEYDSYVHKYLSDLIRQILSFSWISSKLRARVLGCYQCFTIIFCVFDIFRGLSGGIYFLFCPILIFRPRGGGKSWSQAPKNQEWSKQLNEIVFCKVQLYILINWVWGYCVKLSKVFQNWPSEFNSNKPRTIWDGIWPEFEESIVCEAHVKPILA